jgi:hypothetical protein
MHATGIKKREKEDIGEKGFGAHGYQCSLYFWNFENFKILHIYVFKNYSVKTYR